MSTPIRRRVSGLLAGAALLAAVTGLLLLIEPHVPLRGLAVLYLLAVLPIAVVWGTWFAVGMSVASTVLFAWIFVPPDDLRDGVRLGVFLVVAVVTGELAAQLRRRAEEATRLAQEHLRLRRLAVLVGQSVPAEEFFAAVTREVGQFSGADLARMERYEPDGTVTAVAGWNAPLDVGTRCAIERDSVAGQVRQMRRPVRSDHPAPGDQGIRSSVGAPIVVSGQLWGVISASSTGAPFPPNTEAHIAAFTEIVAIAVADAEGRSERRRLVNEQAALRRVATLVARGTPQSEVFAAVTQEVSRLHDLDVTILLRFEPGGIATYLGGDGWRGAGMRVGDTVSLQPSGTLSRVLESGTAARNDDFSGTASLAESVRGEGIKGRISIPITVEGRVWGALGVGSRGGPMPADTEQRLVDFTELVATAIANADSRAEVDRLIEHQASLRHVATLVAREVPPEEIFTAVAEDVGRVLGADASIVLRLDPDGATTVLGQVGDHPGHMQVGSRWELDPGLAMAEVLRTGRPARRDDYSRIPGPFAEVIRGMRLRSSVAIPIVVQGRTWGALGVGTRKERFATDAEQRLENFAELVATAVTNAESRARIAQLLDEQAALRRVATLVASGPTPAAVCAAVAEEIGRPLGADVAAVSRFEPDGTSVLVARFGELEPGGSRQLVDSAATTAVWRTGRSARVDADASTNGAVGTLCSTVSSPVVAEGRLWGAVSVATRHAALPPDTEERLASFTELVAMAIGNAESRAELAASRARVVAAADQTRRRIERDLHDGAQQRLVSLGLELRIAQDSVPPDLPELRSGIDQAVDQLNDVLDELREMSRGIHPAVLSEGGLGPALRTLARRCPLPVELDIRTKHRFPDAVEVAAYYVVSEALTNTTKHAEATGAAVAVDERDGDLLLSISDDGVGGADPAHGSGLIGLRDRVEALGGSIDVDSPPGDGTVVQVTLPVSGTRGT
ncbi:GAF domain-containing protein [Pseudonocardia sp. CA-107938]|uniref:GAF domain-containing protein n=1 Tax=Pseudonocardia sp. CA-107938 TaxID=3240021 RepID=UPI003D8F8615